MNDKLVIRVSGDYMLIHEFLKNYSEIESRFQLLTDYVWAPQLIDVGRGGSPQRKISFVASA